MIYICMHADSFNLYIFKKKKKKSITWTGLYIEVIANILYNSSNECVCMLFVTDLELYPMFVGTTPFHTYHCQQWG